MSEFPKARVVPYSSVVGSSVTLHDTETERVIGQLAILSTGGNTPEDRKQRQILVAEDTARRINCHDDLIAACRKLVASYDADKGAYALSELSDALHLADAAILKAETR
jgi:hypothetical protein